MKHHRKMYAAIVLFFLFLLSTVPIHAQEMPDPSPTRFAKSFEAFARQDKDQPFEKGGIVFAGSSSIRMLNIPKVFPAIKALNRGFGGAHISDMNHYLEQGVLQYEPSTVVFFCGGNDLWSGKSPAQVKTDFDEFTERLFARLPEVRLIVLGWRPSPSRIKIIDKEFALNALFEETANQESRITYLEGSCTRYLDDQGQPMPHLYVSDMLHMNDAGYAIWGEIIRPYLKPLFLVGGDISTLTKIEQLGGVFQDQNKPGDCIKILGRQGWNCFRLRLFVNPTMRNAVVQDLAYTLALAKRIKAAGGQLLLDLHYSDTWADPGHQNKPAAWADLGSDDLVAQVRTYTADVITAFKAEDVLPDIVQVGNEITPGFLWPDGKIYRDNDSKEHWEEFSTLLKAGIAGVREALAQGDRTRIMIHIDCGGRRERSAYFFDHLRDHQVEFDVIGQSYYPWWHGTMDDVRETLKETALKYDKDIVVVETAYPWTGESWWSKKDNMAWPISSDGQAAFLAELSQVVRDVPNNRGLGVIYWYPEAINVSGMNIWNGGATAVFDTQGHVLPGAKAMAAKASRVTLVSLLEEMVERDHMARLPEVGYRCAQFSSYDRHSTEPGSPTWWANADRSYFERIEDNQGRKEHVLMDVAGPGAIVRFWATWHGPGGGPFSNGTLRVYLDGQAEPVIEGPMADLISGGALVDAPLSEGVSPDTNYERQGHNLYLPIPYARHCKVTYETQAFIDEGARKGEALYYQINYRAYDKGTLVETFSLEALKQAQPLLGRVQARLSKPERPGAKGLYVEVTPDSIAPGQSQTMVLNGPAAIRSLTIKLQAENESQALRSTVLKIECDGTRTVWAPLGDFFGTGYHIRPYASWYTEVTADGTMSCDWIMPFHTQATVTLLNLGDQPVELAEYRMGVGPWDWDDQSCYFHAGWRQWSELKTQTNTAAKDLGAFDLNWVTVQGQGHYVGDTLTLFNAAASWWGEGDEKIYVDGEGFPSHLGTGTEDYYGYAWCRPELFASPFHAQPSGAGNITSGFTVNSRYRVLDAIPFQKSLQFDMELWHWAKTRMDYAPTTFWYARPGSTYNVYPDPNEARVPVELSAQYVPKPRKVENALEGETLKVLECTGGTQTIQNSTTFNWSGNQQLWWIDGKPQDHLMVEFNAASSGVYDIEVGLTKAVDYGMVQLAINDQVKHPALDCYFTSVVADAVTLKACRLSAGKNQLKVTLVGANEEAIKRYMFGLDYLLLKP